jgi:translation initiation factor 2 beta subunit (eIF-2beta)/eIF-5
MGALLVSTFSRYQLSREEELNGQVLSFSQKQVLQNQLANIAEEKLALQYTPNSPLEFLQKEAELQGQLGLIQFLFETSSFAEETLKTQSNS